MSIRLNLISGYFALLLIILSFAGQSWGQYVSGDRIQCTTTTRARPNTSLTSTFDSIAVNTKGTIRGGPYAGSGNSLSWFLIRWDTLSEDRYTAEFDGSGTRLFTVYSPSAFTLSTSQQPYWNDSPPAGPVVPLQWTTSQRAQYFEIYRNGTFYVRIDNPNATSFINNSGLTPGANYTFLVAARRNDDPLSFTESNTLTLTMPTQPQAPPTVTSEAASGISTTVATMNLRVNPNGSQTNAFFQYGPTASYGNTTGAGDFGSGTSVVAGSSIYSGLQPNTTYHYRAVATNSGGTSYGNDVAFTTNPTVSPADLTPQNLSIPSPANSGGSLTLNYNIANLGSTASLPTVTKIQIKTAGGSLVQSSIFNTAQVPANSSVSESHSLSLAGISEGSYIAVVIADNFSETGQTNYSNDIATIPFNVLSPKPNLAPFTPPGWPDKLVLSTTTGTSTQTTVATVDDNLFLDVAFKNIGSVSAGRFYFVIMVDGAVRYNSVVNSLTTDQIWSYTDFELGKLPAGNHTVSIIIDSQSNIEESAEEDNIYSIPISVTGPLVPVITITNPQQGDTLTAGASNTLVTWAVSGDLTGITGFDVIFRMNGLQFDHRVVGASARFITWNVPFWLDSIPISVRVEAQGISSVSTEIGLSVAAPAPTTRIAKVRIVSGNPVTIGKPVNFSGDGSVSSDLITSYRWQFSDNSSTATTSPSVTHTFATGFENGKGWVRLVIVSGGIESKTVEKQLTLDGSGHPANTKSSTTPDPINTATGAFLAGHDLMPIHGRMLPGLLQAFYTSSSYRPAENGLTASTPGALGYGWSHSFETRIERYLEEGKRIVIVTFGDAHSEKFSFDEATNSWQSPAGIFSKLEESIDGRFALITHPQQLRHQFGSDGRLQSISDRNGNTLLILWELLPGSTDPNDKRIQRVQVPGGPSDGSATHSIEFIYQAAKPNLLWKLRDPMGHFITFTQDVNDDLVSIMDERNDPLLTTQYTYDPLHQMLTGRDAKGVQFVRNEYDANRRVIDQWDAQNNRTHLEYSADGVFPKITTITRFADSSFALTDPRNEVTKDIHDDRLRLTEQQLRIYNADGTGPFWLSTKTEYDPVTSERLKEINRRGFAAEMTYASGNLLTIKARDGGITAYAYTDPQNPTLPTLITYPDTRVMKKLEYDAHGNLLFTTFPYDPANPTANRRAMLFDAYGQMKKITDANGVSQEYFYDDWGRNDRMLDGEGKEHRYEFNDSGQRTAYVDPLLHRTEYIRNALGKITHTQQADPNDPLHPLITQVDYDENNLPILTTDPLNQLARQYHDELGRVWKEEDDQHNITQHRFDAFSREIETENAKNGAGSIPAIGSSLSLRWCICVCCLCVLRRFDTGF